MPPVAIATILHNLCPADSHDLRSVATLYRALGASKRWWNFTFGGGGGLLRRRRHTIRMTFPRDLALFDHSGDRVLLCTPTPVAAVGKTPRLLVLCAIAQLQTEHSFLWPQRPLVSVADGRPAAVIPSHLTFDVQCQQKKHKPRMAVASVASHPLLWQQWIAAGRPEEERHVWMLVPANAKLVESPYATLMNLLGEIIHSPPTEALAERCAFEFPPKHAPTAAMAGDRRYRAGALVLAIATLREGPVHDMLVDALRACLAVSDSLLERVGTWDSDTNLFCKGVDAVCPQHMAIVADALRHTESTKPITPIEAAARATKLAKWPLIVAACEEMALAIAAQRARVLDTALPVRRLPATFAATLSRMPGGAVFAVSPWAYPASIVRVSCERGVKKKKVAPRRIGKCATMDEYLGRLRAWLKASPGAKMSKDALEDACVALAALVAHGADEGEEGKGVREYIATALCTSEVPQGLRYTEYIRRGAAFIGKRAQQLPQFAQTFAESVSTWPPLYVPVTLTDHTELRGIVAASIEAGVVRDAVLAYVEAARVENLALEEVRVRVRDYMPLGGDLRPFLRCADEPGRDESWGKGGGMIGLEGGEGGSGGKSKV